MMMAISGSAATRSILIAALRTDQSEHRESVTIDKKGKTLSAQLSN